MRIFNVMMSRDLGGIQQAFLDYADALNMQNHDVINITSYGAKINSSVKGKWCLPNLGSWCLLSKITLKLLIFFYKPDIIICHGNRAIIFSSFLRSKQIPMVGVSHNYSIKYLQKCDRILTLTNKLREHLINHNVPSEKIHMLPNMIKISQKFFPTLFHAPVIIGTIGRFVQKKGFIHLLEAISILKNKGYDIKLNIGGGGVDKEILVNMVRKLDINKEVLFLGWVSDKTNFFKNIDIFCLPSLDEPFGIILLEAMMFSKPIVATNSGGPEEIINHERDGLIVDIDDANQHRNLAKNIASALEKMINESLNAQILSKNAYDKLINKYDTTVVSTQLTTILENILR